MFSSFHEMWVVDFEFTAGSGENPEPVCLVAMEHFSGRTMRIWRDELLQMARPPYSIGNDSLFIAYYASAEISCHLALGWKLPVNVIDLYVEFRNATNGFTLPCGAGLLGALSYFNKPCIDAAEKESMRKLVLRGGPWSSSEQRDILLYCERDVYSTEVLFREMQNEIDWPRALLRGQYMKAVAEIERNGIPIDTITLEQLRRNWGTIKKDLIAEVDADYGIYEGETFKMDRFRKWTEQNDISWPRIEATGNLDLKDETFKEMSLIYPKVAPLRELRSALSQMKLSDLTVGKDGRNRCLLSPFSSRTGRNQPSTSHYIYGLSSCWRSLIRPEPGTALAYVDWSQQEFGIAAALSGDQKMKEAYSSGDPYLMFAKQARAVPPDATKESHGKERELFKKCILGVQYGMAENSLSFRISQPVAKARELLRLHQETYRQFWKWMNSVLDYAMLHGRLWTSFGWTIHIKSDPNPRFLQNFPMQANGAEMLRLGCCLAIERGIKVCAPVHDAILIEAPLDEIEQAAKETQRAMADASAIVLDGFRLNTDAKIIKFPDRYMDDRGTSMWERVLRILQKHQL